MEVKELRLGNLVLNRKWEMIAVDLSGLTLLDTWEKDKYDNIPPFSPAPLEQHHLEDFGFEYEGFSMGEYDVDKYDLGDFTFSFASIGYTSLAYKSIELTPVKYIHQLQNLYYALTGEELVLQ